MANKKAQATGKKVVAKIKAEREEVVGFLYKISSEGGVGEYFGGYSCIENAKDRMPFLPDSLVTAAKTFELAKAKLEVELILLRERYQISPDEIEC